MIAFYGMTRKADFRDDPMPVHSGANLGAHREHISLILLRPKTVWSSSRFCSAIGVVLAGAGDS